MKSIHDLLIYNKARDFRKSISILVETFPIEGKYILTNQITRSSRSIPSNIAEGYGRYHFQENIQFLRIARGSLYETKEHLLCAFDEKYMSQIDLDEQIFEAENLLKLLNGYIRYLQKRKRNL